MKKYLSIITITGAILLSSCGDSLDRFPVDQLVYFDSYYQGLYDDLDEFYKEMEEFKQDPVFQCDYDKDDYVIYDEYVFDKNAMKEGPYV